MNPTDAVVLELLRGVYLGRNHNGPRTPWSIHQWYAATSVYALAADRIEYEPMSGWRLYPMGGHLMAREEGVVMLRPEESTNDNFVMFKLLRHSVFEAIWWKESRGREAPLLGAIISRMQLLEGMGCSVDDY